MNEEARDTFEEIQRELVEIIAEMGYQKGRSNKFSIIVAYVYILGDVTQKILQDRTKFSLSTVSNALNTLEENDTVYKKYNQDDHQYHYFLNGTLSDILGRNMGDFQTYFSQLSKKIQEVGEILKDTRLYDKKGYDNIKEFVEKMAILIPAFQNLMIKYQLSTQQHRKEEGSPK
ncbi:MAG: hypothetical protein JW776_08430 [Candidatus Lokiarchaeota archaeon]|nr:hypothetical protein [Candidatus Lokiarchaeota archaeon]